VLRLGAGDEIAVFDGAGREFRAVVSRVARDAAELRIIEEIAAAPEPAVRVTLAQAVLKGDKMDDVVRDATMMGAAAIVPLITDHTVAHVKPGAAPDRWRRIAIASAKQCRRAVVPAVHPAVRFADWLSSEHTGMKILLTEPSAAAAEKLRLSPFPAEKRGQPPFPGGKWGQPPFSASLAVGPEGGWSRDEVDAAVRLGYETLTLGRRTLRADAVAIIAIGVLQHQWGDL
jgi:16S rRNA (uracil1498-N3)-methyltransferase